MADFLTIDGTPYLVVVGTARRLEPERLGTRGQRMFSGKLISSERAQFINAECTIGPVDPFSLVALRQSLHSIVNPIVTIGGAWLGNIRAVIDIVDETPEEDHEQSPPGVLYFVQIRIRQAGPGQ